MLAKLTILSTWGSTYGDPDPAESRLGLKASKEVLVNTKNIVRHKTQGTTDSQVIYKLNRHDDDTPEFTMLVDETRAAIVTASDVSAESALVPLSVYEGALTFGDIEGLSTTTYYFPVDNIVFGSENNAGTATRIWICEGGFAVREFIVSQTIAKIIDLADTATTTSTTSTTSTTTAA